MANGGLVTLCMRDAENFARGHIAGAIDLPNDHQHSPQREPAQAPEVESWKPLIIPERRQGAFPRPEWAGSW
jgi:hypothetical protein